MSAQAMLSELKALRDIISTSIDAIVNDCERDKVDFPSHDEPFNPSSVDIRQKAVVSEAITKIVAASQQLIVSVQAPQQTLSVFNLGFILPTCLGVAEAGNIAELLREAGSKGMHIKDIAKRTGMPARKLGIVMLYLATKHVFREVTPEVFANNEISSILDSGKPFGPDLTAEAKLDSTQGMHVNTAFFVDFTQKAAPYLVDVMRDPKISHSEEANCTAANKAFNMDLNVFDYMNQPEHALKRKQVGKIMHTDAAQNPASTVLAAFDWGSLKPGSLVVDVGGSIGHISMVIAREYPKLKIAVEDLSGTAQDAINYWKENLPAALENKQVEFIGHNFLEPQPKLSKAADVFLLRLIVHDWSDKYAIQILRHLRDVATPDTKLVVIDAIATHACKSGAGSTEYPDVPAPPDPLLNNWGEANAMLHAISVSVLTFMNAGERTKEGFEEIFTESGWKLQEIHWQSNPQIRPSLIAVPA